jgi:hypothetical protein
LQPWHYLPPDQCFWASDRLPGVTDNWTGHDYLPGPAHPDPHIHEFYYDPIQKQWQIDPLSHSLNIE